MVLNFSKVSRALAQTLAYDTCPLCVPASPKKVTQTFPPALSLPPLLQGTQFSLLPLEVSISKASNLLTLPNFSNQEFYLKDLGMVHGTKGAIKSSHQR